MDEIVQVPQEPSETLPPASRRLNFKKVLDMGSWALLMILTPLFFIAYLSQNSFPGDVLYPVKRGIESTLLAAASLNPEAKASLHTEYADRRFSEAEELLLSQSNTAPLNDLVAQVESAQVAIDNVSDFEKQEELTAKVIAQIETYQTKLTNTASQIENTPYPTVSPSVAQQENIIVTTTPVITTPTSIQQPAAEDKTPFPSVSQSQVTPMPSVAEIAHPVSERKIQVEQAVNITNLKLEKVKKDLEEKSRQKEEKEKEKEERSNRR